MLPQLSTSTLLPQLRPLQDRPVPCLCSAALGGPGSCRHCRWTCIKPWLALRPSLVCEIQCCLRLQLTSRMHFELTIVSASTRTRAEESESPPLIISASNEAECPGEIRCLAHGLAYNKPLLCETALSSQLGTPPLLIYHPQQANFGHRVGANSGISVNSENIMAAMPLADSDSCLAVLCEC